MKTAVASEVSASEKIDARALKKLIQAAIEFNQSKRKKKPPARRPTRK
ncbi:MAG TPA: hypothetical protein VGM84_05895 [Steroidobacteraceae bacterium]|jgi:hypothetical protein